MSLKIGIVGLPNVGKSTLFNALTNKGVPAENYPFCTIAPSVGIAPVADARLEKLAVFSRSAKKIPAVVEFVDIAGLVAGAAEGAGLGNQFLAHIREVDGILHLVRVFADPTIVHAGRGVNPQKDIETINEELRLADEQMLARRGERGKDKNLPPLPLLRDKPALYVFNRQARGSNWPLAFVEKLGAPHFEVDAQSGEGIDGLIGAAYRLLDLITFFTTGEDPARTERGSARSGGETRAWTIRRGSRAPEAGAAIHTDFEQKFIKALVIEWQKLLGAGSWAAAREKGLLRTEGRDYVVRDGDVIEFKI